MIGLSQEIGFEKILLIGAVVLTNHASFVMVNWGKKCYKLGQVTLSYIGANIITTIWGSYHKLGKFYCKRDMCYKLE